MAKIGIGVGEEFPVDEPRPPSSIPPENHDPRREHWRRYGTLHIVLHVLMKLAIIGLVIAAAVALSRPAGGPYPAAGYYPYTHHFFFFPFFPILIGVLFLSFAWRRHHGYYGHRRHRHWHDGHHHHGEEA